MATFNANDGTHINELVWPAEGTPRGTVVLVHGYGEHIARYEHVARALAQSGFHVRGTDLRGHGQSGGARGYCNRFGEYLDDLSQLIARAREHGPGLPVYLLGHSFGALISTKYLIDRPSADLAGLVLSSPYFALKLQVPKAKIVAGKIMSKVYGKMGLPSGLKGEDVSRDPEEAAKYDRDPLNNKNATARWFTETSDAQDFVFAHAGQLTTPLLLMAAGADGIADPARAEQVFARVGSSDKTLEVLPGQRHEIFNELKDDRKKTLDRVTGWLSTHATDAAGKLHAGRA
jgi:alpha-beta hydrolase superfamily lysophospholipase